MRLAQIRSNFTRDSTDSLVRSFLATFTLLSTRLDRLFFRAIRTATGCLAAHYEHTIVIREGRAEVLTAA